MEIQTLLFCLTHASTYCVQYTGKTLISDIPTEQSQPGLSALFFLATTKTAFQFDEMVLSSFVYFMLNQKGTSSWLKTKE